MVKPVVAIATLFLSALSMCFNAHAQDKAAEKKEEAKSPWALTGNMSFVSEYRYRGIAQTSGRPALQGGFDLAHTNGMYVGTWASNVNWLSDTKVASNSLEWDLYGGYKGSVGDISYDVGGLYYYYPGNYPNGFTSPNTLEVYGALTWKQVVAKYSHSLTDLFGFQDSKGSGYLDLSSTLELGGGLNLAVHLGYATIPGSGAANRSRSDCSYADWKLGLTYDYVGFTWGLAYVDTNGKGGVGQCYRSAYDKNWAHSTVVLSATKNF
jgi:uncharacterized protein (TIGR02001 family)